MKKSIPHNDELWWVLYACQQALRIDGAKSCREACRRIEERLSAYFVAAKKLAPDTSRKGE